MSDPDPAEGKRSPSGVLRGGYRFQDVFVWSGAMQLLRPNPRFSEVGTEVDDAGNVDDVVLRNPGTSGGSYGQVKWSTRAADPLTYQFLSATRGRGTSILQKLYKSWLRLGGPDVPVDLRLISNRPLDLTDPLLSLADGHSDRLTPAARQADPNSVAGQAVTAWATHIGAAREDLLGMLDRLHLQTGRTPTAELEHTRVLMAAAGLDDSDDALERGLSVVPRWMIDGITTRSVGDIRRTVEELGLTRVDPSIVLSIEAIDNDPHADTADHRLDWTRFYDQTVVPRERTLPVEHAAWNLMASELATTAAEIEAGPTRSVVVRGALRQATLFAVGAALPQTRGFRLVYRQYGHTWTTDTAKQNRGISERSTPIGAGSDLAVAVAVSLDPAPEIGSYLRATGLPVDNLVVIEPADGSDDQAVRSGGHAVALAEGIRNKIRQILVSRPDTPRIHLFLAGPGGLSLMLGHRWNKVRPTTIYEHRGVGRGYAPTFTVDA